MNVVSQRGLRSHTTLGLVGLTIALVILLACAAPTASPVSTSPTAVATDRSSSAPLVGRATPEPAPGVNTLQPQLVDAGSAEAAIRRSYDALVRKDRNALIDSLDPAIRSQPDAMAVFGVAAEMLLGAKVDTEAIAFRDLRFSTERSDGNWALVRVTGYVRNLQFATENRIDTVDVARRVSGAWYLSNRTALQGSPDGRAFVGVIATATAVARQQVATSTAVARQIAAATATVVAMRATATAVARQNEAALGEVRFDIADGDVYIAALKLHTILKKQPDNAEGKNLLASLAPRLPGALVSRDGRYLDFASGQVRQVPNLPKEIYDRYINGEIVAVSPDFKSVEVTTLQGGIHRVDVATGSMKRRDVPSPYKDFGRWNRTGEYLASTRMEPTLEVTTGKTIAPCAGLSGVTGTFWLDDTTWGRYTRGAQDKEHRLVLQTMPSGSCRSVALPGLNMSQDRILLSPDRTKLLIITADKIMESSLDGGAIKKLWDLPKGDLSRIERSLNFDTRPQAGDGSAIHFGGYVISLKTGRATEVPIPVLFWVDSLPPGPQASRMTVAVAPAAGPRGTRFTFTVADGPAGQNVEWSLKDIKGTVVSKGQGTLDDSGGLSDAQTKGQFAFTPGLSSNAGSYSIEIKAGTVVTVQASFNVTE